MNKLKKALLLLGSSLFISSLASCGYQFQGSGSILPEDIKTVAIPVVKNRSTETGLGPELTEKLRSRFERYGVVRVIEDVASADAVLDTEIVDVYTQVRDVTGATDIALEQDLIMLVSSELKRRSGQVLWRNDRLAVRETFAGSRDVVVTTSSSFRQSGIDGSTLGSLGNREVSRGQQRIALSDMMDEASRLIYEDSVAADF